MIIIDVTIDGDQGSHPDLDGGTTALYLENGKTVRPPGPESDKALALLDSLDDTQRKQAV